MLDLSSIKLAWTFALREMRSGLAGFRVFLACIAIGVAAIGAVNSVATGINSGIEAEGKNILGGDLRFELVQRTVTDKERAYLNSLGAVAETISTRSMARREDQSDQSLAEIKAVDKLYPLYGALVTEPAMSSAELFEEINGRFGATAPQILFDRLEPQDRRHPACRRRALRTSRGHRQGAGRFIGGFRVRSAASNCQGRHRGDQA